ncbi:REP-associated tyrosine transposase [Jeotgalibacillus proteolyticus]|uniref:REP-associated tyrosine transposase n=1 Tax=Jeotgalibacillus proteolyticus TaxID=2082395 RepID=UPI003CFB48EB
MFLHYGNYHVICRGNRRMQLFYDARDYRTYLSLIRKAHKRYSFDLLAYCLMPNHVHLLIQPKEDSLSDIMKLINGEYAIYFNLRRKEVGHVFQSRFNEKLVTGSTYLLDVCRYIHNNPVKAQLADHPSNYPWNSYPSYITAHNPNNIVTHHILKCFPSPSIYHFQKFTEKRFTYDDGLL